MKQISFNTFKEKILDNILEFENNYLEDCKLDHHEDIEPQKSRIKEIKNDFKKAKTLDDILNSDAFDGYDIDEALEWIISLMVKLPK